MYASPQVGWRNWVPRDLRLALGEARARGDGGWGAPAAGEESRRAVQDTGMEEMRGRGDGVAASGTAGAPHRMAIRGEDELPRKAKPCTSAVDPRRAA